MKAAREYWTETLEAWQGMVPPLLNPTVIHPWRAVRIGLGIQRAALDAWRESCVQAHELAGEALDWSDSTMEGMARAAQERGR